MTVTELVTNNRGLVYAMARKLTNNVQAMDDLVGEGNVGLVIAAQRFNPDRGVKFSTYACFWIRAQMFNYLSDYTHGVIRVPRNTSDNLRFRLPKMRGKLLAVGIEPTDEMLAAQLGCTLTAVKRFQEFEKPFELSMEQVVQRESHRDVTLGERIPDTRPNPEEVLSLSQDGESAERCLSGLSERDQDILRSRYADNPESLADIGKRQGCSRERIRQVQKMAERRLRRMARKCFDHVPKAKRVSYDRYNMVRRIISENSDKRTLARKLARRGEQLTIEAVT